MELLEKYIHIVREMHLNRINFIRDKPKYNIAGHYHHVVGPKLFDATTFLGLNVLVNLKYDGESRRIQPASMAVLDTDRNQLKVINEEWLSEINRDFDFISSIKLMPLN